ncbi:MAG: cytochrome d ubiquinol oxidase subunit II [Eggerthella lenta]
MEITFFQGLWFLLIFVLIAGYFVLDGFDLGAGVLYPLVAKGDEEKAVVRTSIGPVWDGNEVWLLTAGGALFAAFPAAYATTFSGFYLAVMLVLFGLIVRAVSLEYRGIDHKWAKVWDGCFFVGSLLPALLLGVAVGNIYAGIPMSTNGDYTGIPLLGLITPFTLLCGLLACRCSWRKGRPGWRSRRRSLATCRRAPRSCASAADRVAGAVRRGDRLCSAGHSAGNGSPAGSGSLVAGRPVRGCHRRLQCSSRRKQDCDLGAFIAQSGAAGAGAAAGRFDVPELRGCFGR